MHYLRLPIAMSLMLTWLAGCTPPDSTTVFKRITKLELPANASVKFDSDDHGGPLGDGEFNIHIQATTDSLNEWLAKNLPWGADEWNPGPLPTKILGNCLVLRESGWDSLESSSIWYVARDRGSERLPWHNGDVIVIDPEGGKAWLASWDN